MFGKTEPRRGLFHTKIARRAWSQPGLSLRQRLAWMLRCAAEAMDGAPTYTIVTTFTHPRLQQPSRKECLDSLTAACNAIGEHLSRCAVERDLPLAVLAGRPGARLNGRADEGE